MILHTITLAWNRKRQNGLLLLEMIGSFLVLFAVCAAGLAARDSLQTPLGFEYERIWSMQVRVPPGGGGSASDRDTPVGGEPSRGPSPETVLREVESLEAVESAAIAPFPLFSSGGMRTSHESNGERFSTEIFPVSLEAAETLGIELAEGDWFRPGDGVDAHRPVVVHRMLADQLFGTGSHPVGEIYTPPGDEERRSLRILGIVEHFRKTGDLGREDSLLFDLVDTEEVPQFGFFRVYMQMRPGTDASTEEALLEHMRSLAPTWGFQVDWLEEERQAHLRTGLLPLF
ncbi:MAG: ABC transporter permease, partial [Holophagales bacterium]|nr:ABC transporter permease [Holophagales bacterium]